jgi:hypothetical protein
MFGFCPEHGAVPSSETSVNIIRLYDVPVIFIVNDIKISNLRHSWIFHGTNPYYPKNKFYVYWPCSGWHSYLQCSEYILYAGSLVIIYRMSEKSGTNGNFN